MRRTRCRSTVLLLLLAAVLVMPSRSVAQSISSSAINQILEIEAKKAARTPAQRKIDSQLLGASQAMSARQAMPGDSVVSARIPLQSDGTILLDIKADVSDQLLARIRSLGGTVINAFGKYKSIRAALPPNQIEQLASASEVRFIRPAEEPIFNKVVSEGDITHRANTARSSRQIDGSGITVGVLSDSVEALASLQASGNLPPTCPAGPPCVTVLPGRAGSGHSEGTAMMEIVNSLAPGSNLIFSTANGGQQQFADNIVALRNAGADVIVDDVTYFLEPVFQDGPISQAVNTVVSSGAIYFSSAANDGNKRDNTSGVWEGDYSGTSLPAPLAGAGLSALNFGSGNNTNVITRNSSSQFISLQWSDAFDASGNDYDLYMLDPTGTSVVLSSTNIQNGNDDPVEFLDYSGNATNYRLVVVLASGQPRFIHLHNFRGRLQFSTNGATFGHNAAKNAVTVAAVDVATTGCPSCTAFVGSTTNPVETVSSDGPRRIFYNPNGSPIPPGNFLSTGGALLIKPDIAAADGVQTATPGFDPFFGTSAAAPHAAAIAALALSLNSNLSPSELDAIMQNTALPSENPGPQSLSGAGITDALNVVNAAVPTPSPTVAASVTISPASGNFGNVKLGKSKSKKFSLKNNASKGGPSVTFSGGSISGSGDFSGFTSCNSAVAPKKKCTVTIVFAPSSAGNKSATVTINSNAQNNPHHINVPGNGVAKKH